MAAVLPPRFDMDNTGQHRFGGPTQYFHQAPAALPPRRFFNNSGPAPVQAQVQGRTYDSAPPVHAAGRQQQKRKRAGKRFGNASKRRRGGPQAARAETPSTIPRTTPRAPFNSNTYLIERDGEATTASAVEGYSQSGYTAGYPSLNDKAAELGAKLDFFGTGLPPGLLSEYQSDSASDSEGEEDEDDWQAGRGRRSGGDVTDAEQEAALRALPAGVRARLREESSRLARLEEENLDLKEKLSLARLELEDYRVKYGAASTEAQAAVAAAATSDTNPTESRAVEGS